jgi:peptidoglycan hydrolase-like protein with peptidoglycan-binding domain
MLWLLRFCAGTAGTRRDNSLVRIGRILGVVLSGEPTVEKGISSEWVQYLQQIMQLVTAWSDAIDGLFGDELEQAVRALQDGNSLPQTDVVDGQTWDLLTNRQLTSGGTKSARQRTKASPHVTCPKPTDITEAEIWTSKNYVGY